MGLIGTWSKSMFFGSPAVFRSPKLLFHIPLWLILGSEYSRGSQKLMLSKRSGYFFLKCISKPKTYYKFYLGSEGDGKVIGGTKATKGKQTRLKTGL